MTQDDVHARQGKSGMVSGRHYRFTILTSQLIRMEYDPEGCFEDRPTQRVVNRVFPTPDYRIWDTQTGLEIQTAHVSLFYDKGPFSPQGLWAENRSECRGIYCTWRFGDALAENLGGTARTLDEVDGPCPLGPGLLSRLQGFATLDDSRSFVLTQDGWVEPRRPGVQDWYFFSYGYAYQKALEDFFHLCGPTPLLPRYALGNWWSRFYAYRDMEYLALMDRFQRHGIPLSVSVLDMDWHVTQPQDGGKGWTGYTWNRELFPQPEAFLKALHDRGLKVTLNLHPAEGVQPHEEMYEGMALALGKDASRRQRIPFDLGNRAFLEAYFAYLHHPREREGVDFWWVDWQQGSASALDGLDPLWMLNHYHTQDIGREGKRPLILSRYAGPGSHRYPVGFSGDSVISWPSLAFQPYFTATASNIGYGWWSHDIGGHTHGRRDDELQVRWLQFGVFSPIMRMHSTSNLFNGKEPWRYTAEACGIMTDFLRLRHRLLPYLYTMNWLCHTRGVQLVSPMYYAHPEREEAYQVPNQYHFGSEMIVCPITTPMDASLMRAGVKAWLPAGLYFDFFTGWMYRGGRMAELFRPLAEMPVLVKAGGIIPLAGAEESRLGGAALPSVLDIRVYGGGDGSFSLYEDDGETMDYLAGEYAVTEIALCWRKDGGTEFSLIPGFPRSFLPPLRTYRVSFVGVEENHSYAVFKNGKPWEGIQGEYHQQSLRLSLPEISWGETLKVVFAQPLRLAQNDVLGSCRDILKEARVDYELKESIYSILSQGQELPLTLSTLQAMSMPRGLRAALMEVLLA